MKVFIEKTGKTVTVKASTPLQAMRTLKVDPESVIVVRDKEVILADERLKEGDRIELLSVVSGG